MSQSMLQPQHNYETTAPSSRGRILVVEDDEDIRELLRFMLESEGYEVYVAINGRAGLDLLSEIPAPDLIFLDLMMPIMDGWAFTAEAVKDVEKSQIPVIIMTAFADEVSNMQMVKGVLKKPINVDSLLSFVEKFCPTPDLNAPRGS